MTIAAYAKAFGLKRLRGGLWYESKMKDGTSKMHYVDDIESHINDMNKLVEQDKYKYNKRMG